LNRGCPMGGLASENSIKFFGAALDALDHREAVEGKRSYVHALTLGKCPQPDLRSAVLKKEVALWRLTSRI